MFNVDQQAAIHRKICGWASFLLVSICVPILDFCINYRRHLVRSLILSVITPSVEVLYNVRFRKTLRLQLQLELYSGLQMDDKSYRIYWWRVGHALLIETAFNALHRACPVDEMLKAEQKHWNISFLPLGMRRSETHKLSHLPDMTGIYPSSTPASRLKICGLSSLIEPM